VWPMRLWILAELVSGMLVPARCWLWPNVIMQMLPWLH
jgi:hypothetical protein